ncbi:hypothetical protein CRE_17605 [Caenorhabditis remanei]|uniref:T-box domain-containing protein n=1 Tax=Caenorhabditis remanei TaxID=31234 RepID=E3NHB8_CAERE|nr:hypothetical protein CRE_17605 [Caenorhabditis remanei]
MTTASGIELSLSNQDQWKKFHPMTEMVLTRKVGRQLFPHLNYILKGLNPNELYGVFIHFERVDNNRYHFLHNKWNVFGKGDEVRQIKVEQHLDGWRAGSYWMAKPVSFKHVRITNDPDLKKPNTFVLQSMHKFIPVVGIQKMGDSKIEGFRLDVTEFMAVTAYQSSDIIALKTKLNKFARGKDLPSGSAKPSRGTKRPATSPAKFPSPPSSSEPSSVSPPHLSSETVSPQESPPYSRLPSIESMVSSATHFGYYAPTTASPPGSTQTTGYPFQTHENVQVPMNNENQTEQMQMHQMNEMSWYPMDMHQGMDPMDMHQGIPNVWTHFQYI